MIRSATPSHARSPAPGGMAGASPSLLHQTRSPASAAAPSTPMHDSSPRPITTNTRRRNHSGTTLGLASSTTGSPSSSSPPSSTSSLPLLSLPEDQMSCYALLSNHLDDYQILVEQLLHSFDPVVTGAHASLSASHLPSSGASGASAHAMSTAAAAVTVAQSGTAAVMSRLLRKDQLLQSAVDKLLLHQQLHRSLRAKQDEVARLDALIVDFCSGLGDIESKLVKCSTDEDTLRPLSGELRKHPLQVREVSIFAERLARMSQSAADHLERKELNPNVTRPPAPSEFLMAHSLLRLTEEELIQLQEAEEKTKSDQAAAVANGDQMDTSMSTEETIPASRLPIGSVQPLGKQDSVASTASNSLPSFAKLTEAQAQAAAATPGANGAAPAQLQPLQMWRQESANRSMATDAPQALDLDLASSDSDSDEDD